MPEETLRRAAELFESARAAMILSGMGITKHTTGTDNVKAIANLLMLTGNIGRGGVGFAPLRGQNNVQGACDVGALPIMYPGYPRVTDPEVKAKFQDPWGAAQSRGRSHPDRHDRGGTERSAARDVHRRREATDE